MEAHKYLPRSLNKTTFRFRARFAGNAASSVREGFFSVLQNWEVGGCAEAVGDLPLLQRAQDRASGII